MRDSFSARTIKVLADRAGYRCSNPACRRATTKAHPTNEELSVNLGIAAHITAASPNGPRFNSDLTTIERKSVTNGIWVCTKCSKEIDSAESAYSVETLKGWKKDVESVTARNAASTPDEIAIIVSEIEESISKIFMFLETWQINDPTSTYDFRSMDFEESSRLIITFSILRRKSYAQEIEPDLVRIRMKSKTILGNLELLEHYTWEDSGINYIAMREMANSLNELRELFLLR
ncbi:hypothetical protein BS614_11675 [Paenibacillus xylanexedens]|uniref:hypothetical protein n=1 Tax=Paenibacillus xylanexedens TaxID=528191 RepID=UPI0009380B71|nr:hypothetical protein [Paenibacillus xylanexedens]APO44590.1 hypothetical protein BS614_11675 [Paenibacillus xylanexedens]